MTCQVRSYLLIKNSGGGVGGEGKGQGAEQNQEKGAKILLWTNHGSSTPFTLSQAPKKQVTFETILSEGSSWQCNYYLWSPLSHHTKYLLSSALALSKKHFSSDIISILVIVCALY